MTIMIGKPLRVPEAQPAYHEPHEPDEEHQEYDPEELGQEQQWEQEQ